MSDYQMPEPPKGYRWHVGSVLKDNGLYLTVRLKSLWFGPNSYRDVASSLDPETNALRCVEAAEDILLKRQRLNVNGLKGAVLTEGVYGNE